MSEEEDLKHTLERHERHLAEDKEDTVALRKDVRELVELLKLLDVFVIRDGFGERQSEASDEFRRRVSAMLDGTAR